MKSKEEINRELGMVIVEKHKLSQATQERALDREDEIANARLSAKKQTLEWVLGDDVMDNGGPVPAVKEE